MLALYGHPFSSYTWKAQIALHALRIEYDFRALDDDHPEHGLFVQQNAGPQGKFPVLVHDERVVFEATSIIEYLNLHFPGDPPLIPGDADAAVAMRTLDRVFDNDVMNLMQGTVAEFMLNPQNPDPAILARVGAGLRKSYAWLDRWLEGYGSAGDHITLIECAAAPSLFYADWVEHITDDFPRLKAWRRHLNALPEVSRCIEAARPFRAWFPPGAPERD